MDFSQYGPPSKEWLSFTAANPAAAQDGFSGNDIAQAGSLRQASNEARTRVSEKLIKEANLDTKVAISTITIPSRDSHTIPIRVYKPKTETITTGPPRALIYFHGGGYLFGDETSDDYLCASIASRTHTTILSVIYRHTDEHKHPAQINDSWDAFEYIRSNMVNLGISETDGLGIMGISAGCTLAAGVVLQDLRRSQSQPGSKPLINGVLFSMPWLVHIDNYPFHLFESPGVSSKIQCAEASVIPTERMKLFNQLLGAEDVTDELLNVALVPEADLQQWPKTAFLVNGNDPLRDDGLLFAQRLEKLGYVSRSRG